MSADEVLNALFAPALEKKSREGDLVEIYAKRLLDFGVGPSYNYLYENSDELLGSLGRPARRAEFVLAAWRISPAEDWGDWAADMPSGLKARAFVDSAVEVVAHLVRSSGELESSAIQSAAGHLEVLRPILGVVAEESKILEVVRATREVLEMRDWWEDAEVLNQQAAIHGLARTIEAMTPKLDGSSAINRHPLQAVRSADIERTSLDTALALRGMRELAVGLPVDDYSELWGRVPKVNAKEQPELYAERVLSRVTLEQRESGAQAGRQHVVNYMKELTTVALLGAEYGPVRKQISIVMLDLQPRPYQLRPLSRYLGPFPGAEALAAAERWAARSEPRDLADALTRMIDPNFDGTEWTRVLSRHAYTEAPVLRDLSGKLLERGTTVREREMMARMTRALKLRTHNGTDGLAGLIIKLLSAGRPKEDLRVALILCEGLGPENDRQAGLERALSGYAKRHSYRYTPRELSALSASGVSLPNKYLSQNSIKEAHSLVAEGLAKARKLGKVLGLNSESD